MSFTQDELQSLHTIMEQRLSLHRRELERTFQQQVQHYKRDFEQRLRSTREEIVRDVAQRLTVQQSRTREIMVQTVFAAQSRLTQDIVRELAAHQSQQQEAMAHMFERRGERQEAEQSAYPVDGSVTYADEAVSVFDEIELQTEIPWDELGSLIEHALDERFTELKSSLATMLKDTEHYLTLQIHHLRSTLLQEGLAQKNEVGFRDMQDVCQSVEQLEHLLESMQMAMNANHSLLSNRLYHHQQMPYERAHPSLYSIQFPTTSDTEVNELKGYGSSNTDDI